MKIVYTYISQILPNCSIFTRHNTKIPVTRRSVGVVGCCIVSQWARGPARGGHEAADVSPSFISALHVVHQQSKASHRTVELTRRVKKAGLKKKKKEEEAKNGHSDEWCKCLHSCFCDQRTDQVACRAP